MVLYLLIKFEKLIFVFFYSSLIYHFVDSVADSSIDNAKCSVPISGMDVTPLKNDMNRSYGKSLAECCDLCCSTPGCLSYVWWDKMTFFGMTSCFLKTATGPLSAVYGSTVYSGMSNEICRRKSNVAQYADFNKLIILFFTRFVIKRLLQKG